ncbi:hypothetical protein Mapa_013563 [Marchantia paleacea]|nr:hypothetical protein Mapa_013563 [Marchantia paleacea]
MDLRMGAQQPSEYESLHHLVWNNISHIGIDDRLPVPLLDEGPHIIRQKDRLMIVRGWDQSSPPCNKFQKHHPKAVDVTLISQLAIQCVLRSNIAISSSYLGGEMRDTLGAVLGQPEVCKASIEVAVQQNVAGLDVPVDDGWESIIVQVSQALGSAYGDPSSQGPV